MVKWIFGRGHGRCGGSVRGDSRERGGAAAAAMVASELQCHWAGWLEFSQRNTD